MTVFSFREANREDVPRLVQMLAEDPLGAKREKYKIPLPAAYLDAFEAIDADANHELIVCKHDGEIVGFMQISFLPYLTYIGRWRALIEGVRVDVSRRGMGIGRRMIEYAILRARDRKCHMVQLTTDKTRPQAVVFYEDIGFQASHEGMKLHL